MEKTGPVVPKSSESISCQQSYDNTVMPVKCVVKYRFGSTHS